MKQTLYEILGVERDASPEAIDAAFKRRLAELNAAPARDPNAVVIAREAFHVLSNANQRAAYDASLAARAAGARNPGQDGAAGTWQDESGWFRWGKWVLLAGVLIVAAAWWLGRESTPRVVKIGVPVVIQPPAESALDEPVASDQTEEQTAPAIPTPAQASPAPPANGHTAEEIFAQIAPSVARVDVTDRSGRLIGSGSGVVIGPESVITNCHVALGTGNLRVKLGASVLSATVSVADQEFDLCRLSVPGLEAPAVTAASVRSVRTGQRVYAVGAPQGLELTISEGIVSSLREVAGGTVIQTTAPISPGSSGGGLFDASGDLVGITTFQHRYGQNLNFAVPADWIADMHTRGRESGVTRRTGGAEEGGDSPASLILGRWWCYGSLSGRNGEYYYNADGTFSVVRSDGAVVDGHYRIEGKAVRYASGGKTFVFVIESLTSSKMILHVGLEGQRLVCEGR